MSVEFELLGEIMHEVSSKLEVFKGQFDRWFAYVKANVSDSDLGKFYR
jgi:hypothetical protein